LIKNTNLQKAPPPPPLPHNNRFTGVTKLCFGNCPWIVIEHVLSIFVTCRLGLATYETGIYIIQPVTG